MPDNMHQMRVWKGEFGREYTDRNPICLEDMERLYLRNYGVTRSELNEIFLDGLNRKARILEVGSNIGNQLSCLKKMGFSRLIGLELQSYAAKLCRSLNPDLSVVQGGAAKLPFKDCSFDLVFTSGVLIHIPPSLLDEVMREIYRCSRDHIMGFEYYSQELASIPYRGCDDLLWKADYSSTYQKLFPDLNPVMERRVRYLEGDNVDSMFLLSKRRGCR